MPTRKPIHPGVLLREDVMKELNISITEVAQNLGVSGKTLSELVNGNKYNIPELI